jgi:REP element-mobilizing transposase RayT
LLDAIVGRSIERQAARIHAYCWMTNHLHMFVQVGDEPLGLLMRDIASNYARAFQSKLQTTGHLFERRYHARLVDTDVYLLDLLRYIHLNPVAAGLVTRADEYPWSSYRAYAGTSAPQSWLTVDFALGMLARDRVEAHLAYQRLVAESSAGTTVEDLIHCGAEVLGNDDFVARVRGGRPVTKSGQSMAELMVDACERFALSEAEILSDSREARIVQARAWIAHRATKRSIASLSEVARTLRRDRATLRHAMRQHASFLD